MGKLIVGVYLISSAIFFGDFNSYTLPLPLPLHLPFALLVSVAVT